MKYCIRKVPERNTKYLEKLLPEAIIVNDVNHNGAIWSFLKSIETADDDCIYIQDDMLLCKDFKSRAETYVKQYPDEVIVFSTLSEIKNKQKTIQTEGFYTARNGGWLLATYIPKDIARAFKLFFITEQYKKIPQYKRYLKSQFDDIFFCRWLDMFTSKKVFVTNPSLCGHNELEKSVINPSRPKRISPMFDYEDCEK